MSMKLIRSYYRVPAKRGGRVAYSYNGVKQFGRIAGSDHANRLRVIIDGDKTSKTFHPTYNIEYL